LFDIPAQGIVEKGKTIGLNLDDFEILEETKADTIMKYYLEAKPFKPIETPKDFWGWKEIYKWMQQVTDAINQMRNK
jgi:hypothetical protein